MATSWLNAARVATVGSNITCTGNGTSTLDGVSLSAGDRILVKDQSTASENGVYVWSAGGSTWSRASDFATGTSSVTPEVAIRVSEGAVNAHSAWALVTQSTIDVGTSALAFARHLPVDVADDIARSAGAAVDRVVGIRGRGISSTTPARGEVLKYRPNTNDWAPGRATPGGWFDVKDYGAVGDGVTDDSAAIQSAIAAMGSYAQQGGTLFFPEGNFYCASDIHVYKQIFFQGVSGYFTNGLSRITFAAGKQVIVWCLGSPYGGNGAGSAFFGLDFVTTPLSNGEWAGSTAVSVGARRHLGSLVADGLTGQNYAYLECVKAGTTGSSAPALPQDGDCSAPFQASHAYQLHEIVRGTTDQQPPDGTGSNLITSVLFVCTTPGTTGASPPVWNTTSGNTTTSGTATFLAFNSSQYFSSDGTAVWASKTHNCIYARARIEISNCSAFGATNAGFYHRATVGYPTSNCNGWYMQRCRIAQCGVGIMASGGDANVGCAIACDVESPGYAGGSAVPGQGGVGVWDGSLLGCNWISCQVASLSQYGAGPAFKATGGAQYNGVFLACYSESDPTGTDTRSQFSTPAVVVGGNHGALFDPAYQTALRLMDSAQGSQNIVTKQDDGSGGSTFGYFGSRSFAGAPVGMNTTGDTGYMLLGITTQMPSTGDRWWALAHNLQPDRIGWAVAGESATWPSGGTVGSNWHPFWFVTANGADKNRFFLGPYYGDPPSIGYGTAAPTGGYHIRGSLYLNGNAALGEPFGWVCTSSGTPGSWLEIPGPLAGETTVAMGDTNQTLTAAQLQRAVVMTTGALTANRTVTVTAPSSDAHAYQRTIRNACSGAFNVVVSTGSGSTVTVANGKTAIVGVDTGGVFRITADV